MELVYFMRRSTLIFLIIIFIATPFTASAARAPVMLAVPFTPQAPHNEWKRQPFADACEEASALMVQHFFSHTPLPPETATREILGIVNFEKSHFGFHKDTNALMTVRFMQEYLHQNARVVNNPSQNDIIAELDAGRPIMVPVWAHDLQNAHYADGGKFYHMIVLVGYDAATHEFVTHDPGTHTGAHYRYPMARVMAANHDWNYHDTAHGARKMIFTNKESVVY